jgi:hypothetical protein
MALIAMPACPYGTMERHRISQIRFDVEWILPDTQLRRVLFNNGAPARAAGPLSFHSLVTRNFDCKSVELTRVRVPQRARRFVLRVNRHRISDLYSAGLPRPWRWSVARSGTSWSRPNYADAGYFQVALLVLKGEGRKRERRCSAKFMTKF